jgi:hypothetical protein
VATDQNSERHRALHACLREAWSFAEAFPIGAANDDRFLLYLNKWVDKVKQVGTCLNIRVVELYCCTSEVFEVHGYEQRNIYAQRRRSAPCCNLTSGLSRSSR